MIVVTSLSDFHYIYTMEFWSIFLLHFCSRRMRHHWREESVWMGSVLGKHTLYIVQVEGWGLELPRSWGDLCILGWVHTTHWPALPTCTTSPTCTIHSASWPSDLSISCPSANLQLPSDLCPLICHQFDGWSLWLVTKWDGWSLVTDSDPESAIEGYQHLVASEANARSQMFSTSVIPSR